MCGAIVDSAVTTKTRAVNESPMVGGGKHGDNRPHAHSILGVTVPPCGHAVPIQHIAAVFVVGGVYRL